MRSVWTGVSVADAAPERADRPRNLTADISRAKSDVVSHRNADPFVYRNTDPPAADASRLVPVHRPPQRQSLGTSGPYA